ncbi:hypothetical protein JMF97_30955, partial [Micromonospora fiedleri]
LIRARHQTRPSERCDLAGAAFAVVTQGRRWSAPGALIAGVNVFGFGGTNAHAILREPPPAAPGGPGGPELGLATLRAHSVPALRQAARDLAAHLRAHPHLAEAAVRASAGTARDHPAYRLSVVAACRPPARPDRAADTRGAPSPPA